MKPLRFLDEAAREAEDAASWYEAERAGLGDEFIAALAARARRAEEIPGAGRLERDVPARFELRWYDLDRFPYSLLVGAARGERLVVAVAHQHRRPGYWIERVAKLGEETGQ